jgi:broad specificity phosphatase PhoE
MSRSFVVRACLCLLACQASLACVRPATAPSGAVCANRPVTVVVTRHAEKASEAKDAELSEVGRARALRLRDLLAASGASRLFATDVVRTQETLAPLAERLHRTVEVRPAGAVGALARELASLEPGTVAVVAHHSNGVPGLVQALGAELGGLEGGMLGHDSFDRVFVLTLGCGTRKTSLVELRD